MSLKAFDGCKWPCLMAWWDPVLNKIVGEVSLILEDICRKLGVGVQPQWRNHIAAMICHVILRNQSFAKLQGSSKDKKSHKLRRRLRADSELLAQTSTPRSPAQWHHPVTATAWMSLLRPGFVKYVSHLFLFIYIYICDIYICDDIYIYINPLWVSTGTQCAPFYRGNWVPPHGRTQIFTIKSGKKWKK